ncbi:hypothetical protein DXG01_003913 [Tephrocybe rancida]|nr:hypothetical protein DXG01_003913 [Tephrocybe rancida]
MDPLRKLRDLIASVDNKDKSPQQDHREIYRTEPQILDLATLMSNISTGYIEREVLSPKSPLIKQVPTLEVVVYAIESIFTPTFVTRRIPDLLDLLATVEFYRKRTLDYAHQATVWNEYYKIDSTCLPLRSETEALLQNLEHHRDTMRQIYIQLISESPRLFQADLSNEEADIISKVGFRCCECFEASIRWTTDSVDIGRPIRVTLREEDPEEIWPRPHEDEDLFNLVKYYTRRVVIASDQVQSEFVKSANSGD